MSSICEDATVPHLNHTGAGGSESIYNGSSPFCFPLDLKGILIRPILYTDGSPGLNAVAERSLRLVNSMAFLLNFTVRPVYGDNWVYVGADGSLQGVGRLLEINAGDLLSQTHELTLEHASRLQFVFPTVTHREEAFFRQPSRIYENIIFRPFSYRLKFALFVTAGSLALMMWMFLNFSERMVAVFNERNHRSHFRYLDYVRGRSRHGQLHYHSSTRNKIQGRMSSIILRSLQTITESVLWVVALFTQQGGWHETTGNGKMQLLSTLGLLISIVTNFVYSAKVLSIIRAREAPITSYTGLLASGIRLYVDRDAQNAVKQFITENEGSSKRGISLSDRILDADSGLIKILQEDGNNAFLSYRFYLDNSARSLGTHVFHQYCHSISSVWVHPRGLQVFNGMYVRKHSPLRKIFRYSLVYIRERGLMDSGLQSEFTSTSKTWCKAKLDGIESLPYSVTAPCFTVLTFGMLAAALLLTVENFLSKFEG